MAIEHTTASVHAGHQVPRHSTPVPGLATELTWRMPADTFEPSGRPAEPGPSTSEQGNSKLAGLANLGRLQHGLHLLAPVGNLAKAAAKTPVVLDVAQTSVHAAHGAGAGQVVAHAGHGLDLAKGGGFLARMGGPLSAIATGLSAVVAVFDIKRAIGVSQDPHASRRDKALSTTQAVMSGASGAAGLLAALGATGVALPIAIPTLLTISTVMGLAGFAVSLLNRKSSHQGH